MTILEFIDEEKGYFKIILKLLQPKGGAFYNIYLRKNYQFNNHTFLTKIQNQLKQKVNDYTDSPGHERGKDPLNKMFDMTFPEGILDDFSFGEEALVRNEPARRFFSWRKDHYGS